jgi:tRNA A37 threonylcarbamoyladenosine dehydratase
MSDFSRQEKLIGGQGMNRLAEAKVAVFGIGGVGGYAAEALARAAIGCITLIDSDDIEATNINRQIVALKSSVGKPKVELMRERIQDINPGCRVTAEKTFDEQKNVAALIEGITYAVDAVDNVTAKLAIISACRQANIPVISAMGAGNRISGIFRVMDISETKNDGLAKVMRRELRKRNIEKLKCVCCDEQAMLSPAADEPISSISYMPGLCGLTLAGEVIRDIAGGEND